MRTWCTVYILIVCISYTVIKGFHNSTPIYGHGHFLEERSLFELDSQFSIPEKHPSFAWIINNLKSEQEAYIKERLLYINSVTCVKWIQADLGHNETVVNPLRLVEFVPVEKGCRAEVNSPATIGANRWAKVYVSPECITSKSIVHQIGHVMGFGHEHQRNDRDCYVKIDPKLELHPLLNKVNAIDSSFPYDLYSFMHYRRSDYIKHANEGQKEAVYIGRYDDDLSGMDLAKLEYRYCGAKHICERRPKRCPTRDKNGCPIKS